MLTARNLDRNWKLNKNVFTTYKICLSKNDFFFVISFNAAEYMDELTYDSIRRP